MLLHTVFCSVCVAVLKPQSLSVTLRPPRAESHLDDRFMVVSGWGRMKDWISTRLRDGPLTLPPGFAAKNTTTIIAQVTSGICYKLCSSPFWTWLSCVYFTTINTIFSGFTFASFSGAPALYIKEFIVFLRASMWCPMMLQKFVA